MTLHELARLIPKEYRDSILDENVIYKAIPSSNDRHMLILFTVWSNYCDPSGENDLDCPACVNNIYKSFKQLQPILLDIRKQENILEEL